MNALFYEKMMKIFNEALSFRGNFVILGKRE